MSGWGFTDRPAVSVGNAVGRGLIGGSGAKAAIVDALARGTFTPSQGDGTVYAEATRITVDEAALLQSYGLPSHYPERRTMTKILALDDFAGTGWGVACQRLGVEERGVEIMPEAQATRAANGMHTIGGDIWEHLEATAETPLAYDLLISSPPCQTFSMAGGGAGRRALDEVVALIDSKAYADVAQLRAFGETHDPRTSLVLTPLVRAYRDAPTYIVLEQVPPVLPVWERMAVELRGWGYSVVTGVLNAEQYGVPQTRRRAVLIARADGKEATMPTPTHSRYYSRDPKRLDPDVLPWVSMAQALGWGRTQRPSVTVTGGGTETGGAEPLGHLAREVAAEDWVGRQVSGYSSEGAKSVKVEGNARPRAVRDGDEPSLTVTGNADRMTFEGAPLKVRTSMGTPEVDGRNGSHELDPHERPAHTVTTKADSWVVEGATEPPADWVPEPGAKYFHPMSYGRRGAWPGDEPAPTIRGVQRDMPPTYEPHPRDAVTFVGHQYPDNKSATKPNERQRRDAELPSPTITSGSRAALWEGERPATTVQGDARVCPPGHKVNADDERRLGEDEARERYGDRAGTKATRVTVDEAAALQSYPPAFVWCGTKTKQFLQIGNAVPPLLAEAILRTLLDDETGG